MELEQRVKALEYEMKILKNEIQKTLLDIQEQILVHYYPTLRSEQPARIESAPPPLELPRPKEPPSVPEPTLPVVKKVSLDEIRATHTDPKIVLQSNTQAAPQTSDAMQLRHLMDWALHSASQIGGDRTVQLIEACSRRGIVTPEIKELLLQVAPLNRRAAPEQVALIDIIRTILKLDSILEREVDTEEALALVEEAKLG